MKLIKSKKSKRLKTKRSVSQKKLRTRDNLDT